ncbi:unnamed protein product [Eruca vesicaria subsp. sativa]|uniref:Uncharacterized protein n=1 Tax=Eruca vesicaria subsp. sativa TaxID=29727 RepID=A0ABC8JN63_ERUVS|nr:unnamed protein product [Eruca vesicaria subsp. sativa]
MTVNSWTLICSSLMQRFYKTNFLTVMAETDGSVLDDELTLAKSELLASKRSVQSDLCFKSSKDRSFVFGNVWIPEAKGVVHVYLKD